MKCYIEVTEENQKEWTWNIEHIDFLCAEWEKIAFNVFQDKTEIKLDLIKCNRDDIIGMECTKLPFQRNFKKQLAIYKQDSIKAGNDLMSYEMVRYDLK